MKTGSLTAKQKFKLRVTKWANKLGVPVKSATVAPMRNKWASFSTSGRIMFDQALLDLPPRVQDYVIVHELLHHSIPNHGRLWKSLMLVHLGEYDKLEGKLKSIAFVQRRSATFPRVKHKGIG